MRPAEVCYQLLEVFLVRQKMGHFSSCWCEKMFLPQHLKIWNLFRSRSPRRCRRRFASRPTAWPCSPRWSWPTCSPSTPTSRESSSSIRFLTFGLNEKNTLVAIKLVVRYFSQIFKLQKIQNVRNAFFQLEGHSFEFQTRKFTFTQDSSFNPIF